MASNTEGTREGNLEAPTRHPLDWTNPSFFDEENLFRELERVYDICHGCRRCFNLCNSFPTLFDAIDESESMELDTVPREAYWEVVDHCYLCDMCYMSKCPYVPPHEWNVDFPHLMLRAKAVKFKKGEVRARDRILTSTDNVGKLAGIPVVTQIVNATNKTGVGRKLLDKVLGVHPDAILPEYHSSTLRKRLGKHADESGTVVAAGRTRGKVALFATCYCNYNEPGIGEDLAAVFRHNEIPLTLAPREQCCGMPKLELGDLDAVRAARDANIPELVKLVDSGWDIVAPVPSCVLMFKQELPLMFPDDADVARVRDAIFDPFEYLMLRHRHGHLKTDFKQSLGSVSYHVACHLRVQNIGMKTRDLLQLIPETTVEPIERCSGHDGTYAVKSECHQISMKICRPVISNVTRAGASHYSSDCPMAGHQIENGLDNGKAPEHPLSLLRMAYGI
ncbi:MAG: heterodisulfide reductase-related iron-sulfur binding cluster [Gammaproteobacteria bacterium]|nr:heterodisulfide reductase-related iron-sulfur binding cluster [Gammaproteobacteria bacterium]MDH3934730.1 heterodisulfide reductase-related iron-sulfur binding cluster [Gammaproteobacteria bacterium]MDH3971420.1 heterodisulfide reductase-related iron-sulfur binding cluster [Gammaproteobacteria bacterium]MDH3985938.1 heterodisulfide reductase-related iron-sulfur binding cluster [Gammaproteobacteria bacterium]